MTCERLVPSVNAYVTGYGDSTLGESRRIPLQGLVGRGGDVRGLLYQWKVAGQVASPAELDLTSRTSDEGEIHVNRSWDQGFALPAHRHGLHSPTASLHVSECLHAAHTGSIYCNGVALTTFSFNSRVVQETRHPVQLSEEVVRGAAEAPPDGD